MILRVIARHFLPFRDKVEFPLADQGLVLIRGDNRVSAALNDNGSGKTSILHAIAWCLFGEDLAGRKADAVANRFTTETCQVQVDIEDEQGIWSVIRRRRPAALWVEGEGILPAEESNMDVVQEYIESRVGFGLRTFRNAVVFGQGAFDRFAQAEQGEQMKMLDEIQGIDYSTPRAGATDWRKNLVAKMGEIENGVRSDSDNLIGVRSETKTLTALRDSYEYTKSNAVKGLKARMLAAVDQYARTEADLKALDVDARTLARARK
jgi:DNA repair exonuclease SbcCD ATPase subunit